MASKPMKAAGVSGKGGNDRRAAGTRRSPLAPSGTGTPRVDDVRVAEVRKGSLRPRVVGTSGGSDAALGMRTHRSQKATTAGAQFRVSGFRPGPMPEQARPTQANGRTVPPVMGSKQRVSFDTQRGVLY
jgi:hypothetical protein